MDKQEVYALLEEKGIDTEITEHEAAFTVEQLDRLGLPHPETMAKNLFLRDQKKRNYYVLTVREDAEVDLKRFGKACGGGHLSFGSEEDLKRILGLEKGSVTPFGLLNDGDRVTHLWLDRRFRDGRVSVHPNENTATVCLRTADLEALIREHGNTVDYYDAEEGPRLAGTAYGGSFAALAGERWPERAEELFSAADREYRRLAPAYADLPKGEKAHVVESILPMAAVYRVLKAEMPESALDVMYDVARPVSTAKGKRYREMTERKNGPEEFLGMLCLMVKTGFGPGAGFGLEFLEEGKKKVSFDITACPYARVCGELGCPELTAVFCRNDEYSYGDLCGVRFLRTSTIGTGGEKCDFRFIRED